MKKKLMSDLSRGFTFVKLLAVIAIIAIIGTLTAVILASSSNSRSNVNSPIYESMSIIRSQAEVFYNANGSEYDGMCNYIKITRLLTAAENYGDGATAECNADSQVWAASAKLNTRLGRAAAYFCVDNTGISTTTTSVLGSNTSC